MKFWSNLAFAAAAAVQTAAGEEIPRASVRYLRPAGGAFETECRIDVIQRTAGWTVTSRTDRRSVRMEVEALRL